LFIPPARETVEMMYEFEKDFVVTGSLFTRTFGVPATPYRAGVKATVAWYKRISTTPSNGADVPFGGRLLAALGGRGTTYREFQNNRLRQKWQRVAK